jgi:hypothetical protein
MKFILFLCGFCCLGLAGVAQDVKYSEPSADDVNLTNFDIIGKVSGNYLIYKDLRSKFRLSIYDDNMALKDNVNLDFLPERTLSTEFIAYPDFVYLIYQYQKRSAMYCTAVALDGNGKVIIQPQALDTTHLGFFSNSKIYNVIYSEDKSKIMLYKIQKKYETFTITTLLFNLKLQLIHKSEIATNFDDYRNSLSDFFVDNGGNLAFTVGNKQDSRNLQQSLLLAIKRPESDSLELHNIDLKGNYLAEVYLKVDNQNNQYVINSFYYTKRNSNIDGLFIAFWNKKEGTVSNENLIPLDESFKSLAKSEGNTKQALNDFFIRDVILKNDGGFILAAEDRSVVSRYNGYSMPYYGMYGINPFASPFGYYSPIVGGYYNPYFNNYYNSQVRFYYDNVAVFNVENNGKLDWKTIVHKIQYDDNSDNYLSFTIMLTGGQLHFLYNQLDRHNQLLNEQIMSPDGNVVREPPFRSLDQGYEFMPKFAKQVSSYQIIIPCTFRNYICFSKITF